MLPQPSVNDKMSREGSRYRPSFDQESRLLPSTSKCEDFDPCDSNAARSASFRFNVWNQIVLAINLALVALNLTSFWLLRSGTEEVRLVSHDFTKDAIEMELRPFDDVFGNHPGAFLGDPRPELDAAWSGLLHGYNLRVPADVPVMPATGNNSLVELTDGSGDHFATLAVLHELHCLKTIRQYLFPDYYPETYETFKPLPGEMIGDHMSHCFDILRQASMCRADMTLLVAEWWEGEDIPQNVVYTPHLCANWDRLSDWAQEHSFQPFGSGLIVPPGGWSTAN